MFPLKLFLIIIPLIHNANSINYSRPPLRFPPGRLSSPSAVIPSVSSPTGNEEQGAVTPASYPPRPLLEPCNPPLPILPKPAEDIATEKLIIIYPINHGVPSSITEPQESSVPKENPASDPAFHNNINRAPPPPLRKPTAASPPIPSSGIPQNRQHSVPQTTRSPIKTSIRRTTMQRYSTPLPSRSTTKVGNFSPLSITTHQLITTSSQPPTFSDSVTTPRSEPKTVTPPPSTTVPYSTSTTPQAKTPSSTATTPTQSSTTVIPCQIQISSQPPISTSQPATVPPRSTTPGFKPVQTLINFTCKVSNQYYATANECDSYIECKEYVAVKKLCPKGLHFKKDTIWPYYPCAYPSEAKCTIGTVKQPTIPEMECTQSNGFYSVINEDCSKYMMCQGGVAFIMNCPYGLVFNMVTKSCDWPINVPSCKPEAFKNFKCPTPPSDNDDMNIISKHKYSNSCDKYIACQHGFPRLLSCAEGLSFHENSQACVPSKYVTDCVVTN